MDNIKLAFADQFMWNFIILNKSDNKIQTKFYHFRETRLFARKNLKFRWAQTTIKFNIFCWNFEQDNLIMSTEGCSGVCDFG